MRISAKVDGVSAKAYAGSTGVLLAMNVSDQARKGLLGFAIERASAANPSKWLESMLHFPSVGVPAGSSLPSRQSPIQKFRWSDYTVEPGTKYTYTIHPVYAKGTGLDVRNGPQLAVRTMGSGDEHFVIFNRAAAASQAFSRTFPLLAGLTQKKKLTDKDWPDEAWVWLSRGVREEIVGFVAQAKDHGFALDIAAYEYEEENVLAAVAKAANSGAHVRLVYHAKAGTREANENKTGIKSLPKKPNVEVYARVPKGLMHDKYMVLSKLGADGNRTPIAVLAGSTNFTENGIYRQANVLHVAQDPSIAAKYLRAFEELVATARDASATTKWITANDPILQTGGFIVGFSPRSGKTDLDEFTRIVTAADTDVLFSTAFALYPTLLNALLGKPNDGCLRYGIQNTASKITGIHADRTASFTVPAISGKIEGWLKESWAGQKGNIHIHTKAIVTNFTTDSPTIISGSHNLSANASGQNDENFFIIRGNPEIADAYGCEILRLYDHYRFRAFMAGKMKAHAKVHATPALTTDDSWTQPYFTKGLAMTDRIRFCP
jgi:phosphatidylserine/phosphatidylglycerophosphate/cardiolipin synthase-like enzyme